MQVASNAHRGIACNPCKRSNLVLRQHAGFGRQQSCLIVQAAYTITELAGGRVYTFDKDRCTIGSSSDSDIVVQGSPVVGLHALVERKGSKQMFVKALCGEEMWDDSLTWLDGDQLRPRVQYVLSTGSLISIGTEQNMYRIEFEQPSAPNPMLEMMMQGMLDQAKK